MRNLLCPSTGTPTTGWGSNWWADQRVRVIRWEQRSDRKWLQAPRLSRKWRQLRSTSDPRLHFGFGHATAIDTLEVHQPSGLVEKIKLPGIDGPRSGRRQRVTLTRPAPKASSGRFCTGTIGSAKSWAEPAQNTCCPIALDFPHRYRPFRPIPE